MTDDLATLRTIEAGRVIAILRGDPGLPDDALAAALADGGVTALEITMDSPDATARIERLARAARGRLAIGAGTVRTRDHVSEAAVAGATFIVSPHRDVAVIHAAVARGLVVCPGCFTPSEIVEAIDAGAQTVKLFPAQVLGPAFVRAVRAPLGEIRLVPTVGIKPEVVRAYREAGAWAFGVGSELVGRAVRAAVDVDVDSAATSIAASSWSVAGPPQSTKPGSPTCSKPPSSGSAARPALLRCICLHQRRCMPVLE